MWPFSCHPKSPTTPSSPLDTAINGKTIKGTVKGLGWLRIDFTDDTRLQIKLGEYLGSEDNALVYHDNKSERPIGIKEPDHAVT